MINVIDTKVMSDPSAANVLSRINEAARARGLNGRALARRAGVRPETLSRIATRGTCDFATLERLARAVGLRISLEGSEPQAPSPARDEVLRKASLIRSLARAHGVRMAELFGSAARGEDGPDSDLDFMVELERGRSLLDLIGFAEDLQQTLGRRVDAVTRAGMKPRVLAQAQRDAIRVV